MLLLQYIRIMEFWRNMTSGLVGEEQTSMSYGTLQSFSLPTQTNYS